ncbi:hypothetical protein [Marinoscillum sp. MHG1-6]|uniref:hypothetical protein n=1 Tax=Marinoscillum sp. MHG1-6 TaxID=2959627 RepID=UPI0021582379|nr:hypothetical protein [Marinoscillum sp. MHG1-6]
MKLNPLYRCLSLSISLSLFVSSCSSTYYSHRIRAIPESDKTIQTSELLRVFQLPNDHSSELFVEVNNVIEQEITEEHITTKHIDHSETRISGVVTIVLGALLALIVGTDTYDEDTGQTYEANPQAAKVILFSSLAFGGIMSLISDSEKDSIELVKRNSIFEEYSDEGRAYVVWPELSPSKSVLRSVNDGLLAVDLLEDFGLDYFDNQETATIYFKSVEDTAVTHTLSIEINTWLKKTIVNKGERRIATYYAPSKMAEIAFSLSSGRRIRPIKKVGEWYKIEDNKEIVYVHDQDVEFYYSLD